MNNQNITLIHATTIWITTVSNTTTQIHEQPHYARSNTTTQLHEQPHYTRTNKLHKYMNNHSTPDQIQLNKYMNNQITHNYTNAWTATLYQIKQNYTNTWTKHKYHIESILTFKLSLQIKLNKHNNAVKQTKQSDYARQTNQSLVRKHWQIMQCIFYECVKSWTPKREWNQMFLKGWVFPVPRVAPDTIHIYNWKPVICHHWWTNPVNLCLSTPNCW